jgi:hypothetical protein
MRRALQILVLIVLSVHCLAQSQLDDILKKAGDKARTTNLSGASLSNTRITAGLKEALNVSTGKAVALTGKPDGFLKNAAIKILLPDKLQKVGSGLRMLGMGAQMDDLEVGMNRAAEQATPQAKKIFLDAVTRLSFDDARQILSGTDTAATDYFKRQTTAELTTAFAPIVHDAMLKVGVMKQYNALMQNPAAATFARQRFDIDNYVVGKTLDGLFYMLAEQEKSIRQDPAARTTALLKEVFGKRP